MSYSWTRLTGCFIQIMLFTILKLLRITALLLLLLSALHSAKPQKIFSSGDTLRYIKHGDIMLAGIFQFTRGFHYDIDYRSFLPPKGLNCRSFHIPYLRHFLAFDFAIEEINKNPDILPNITLGYDIYDTCGIPEQAIQATMRALSGGVKHHWNYRCGDNGKIMAFIGHLFSTPSQAISQILNLYGYPQISYGESFKDKTKFPFFYHTAHGSKVVNKAIIKLLKYFDWTWIGLITEYEDDLLNASENLKEESFKSEICIEYSLDSPESFNEINTKAIKKTNSRTLVLNVLRWSCSTIIKMLLQNPNNLIFTKDILSGHCVINKRHLFVLEEALFFAPQNGNIIGLKEVLQKASPVDYPNNEILQRLWLSYFDCVPPNKKIDERYWCRMNHSLASLSNMEYDVDNFRTTYSVYLAVYAVAHALNNMYMAEYKAGKHHGSFIQKIHPKQLNKFIRNLHFQTPSGDDIVFDEMGISNRRLELLRVLIFPNKTYTKETVGEYNPNANESDRFFIRKDYNNWAERVKQEHSSPCADTCLPGYRRAVNKRIYCCYLCEPCPAGEYSSGNDVDKCTQCPEDEWPNSRNTACVKRPVDFLSFHDLLGSLLISIIFILFVFSIIILVIFIKYRKTHIVRANNRNLSYTILISLMLCFLCSLLFIGNPTKLTCLLQNIIFNFVFALAVSSILAKTITVITAFNVTKPNNRFRILFRKNSHVFIILCLIGEFGICLCWIYFYPPYSDRDSVSKPGILILYCNVGSHVIFYLALGYNSFLALMCFFVAYFAKKLPDRFNEAHHITFSMLVFCSVWISFIPAYISTKGKYLMAVQVFAILASSAGVLGFIFIPKCFIILFRPEINVKKCLYIGSK